MSQFRDSQHQTVEIFQMESTPSLHVLASTGPDIYIHGSLGRQVSYNWPPPSPRNDEFPPTFDPTPSDPVVTHLMPFTLPPDNIVLHPEHHPTTVPLFAYESLPGPQQPESIINWVASPTHMYPTWSQTSLPFLPQPPHAPITIATPQLQPLATPPQQVPTCKIQPQPAPQQQLACEELEFEPVRENTKSKRRRPEYEAPPNATELGLKLLTDVVAQGRGHTPVVGKHALVGRERPTKLCAQHPLILEHLESGASFYVRVGGQHWREIAFQSKNAKDCVWLEIPKLSIPIVQTGEPCTVLDQPGYKLDIVFGKFYFQFPMIPRCRKPAPATKKQKRA